MDPGNIQSKFVHALQTQGAAQYPLSGALPCPYPGHHAGVCIFQSVDQLYDHAKAEHATQLANLKPTQAREKLRDEALKLRRTDPSSDATAGGSSTLDITAILIEPTKKKERRSPPFGRKRNTPHTVMPERTCKADARLYHPNAASPLPRSCGTGLPSPQPHSPALSLSHSAIRTQAGHRQPDLIELQRYDPRYPGLLLQADSRSISQEQLASEVKSIYAVLIMVETKCVDVDRAQAAAAQDNSNPNHKLISDHWQTLIAIHRTLLHEYHDFFLASQHPSASPALRRLAAKYSMPARIWKHGIHSLLELLRRHLPDSNDYMMAFIYFAYQMMTLLYETVPAFEDTWIEYLGDLGRYRMAIEVEDIRDKENWAGVARSWYTRATDKNPNDGRLYYHLAILAGPNTLQQLYYCSRSLTCVKPFPSARESILTLLDPILSHSIATYLHALPIDINYIKAHALLIEKTSLDDFKQAVLEFTNNLDNHIGRVTANWKEQGVYIAVTNLSSWFGYGIDDNIFRQIFLTELFEKVKKRPPLEEQLRTSSPADLQDLTSPVIPKSELLSKVNAQADQPHFAHARRLTYDTFALVLRRIGDKNILPHVHIMLLFLTTFAANTYVSHLLVGTPWNELVAFLNTLVKTESQAQSVTQAHNFNTLFSTAMFPKDDERSDELPLPEDCLVRGLIWAHDCFPEKWFEREHDEEERYLELPSTVKRRMERVLRLGHKLTTYDCWISYCAADHTFSVLSQHT